MAAEPLLCPRCATRHGLDERFCPECGMPLVHGGPRTGDEPVTDRHARARKVKPQYADGDLVRVASGRNLTEAEFIQGLLLEEGVPSLIRRARGFDVPDFLAAGPRDVLVPESGALTARQILLEAELVPPARPGPDAARLALGLGVAMAVVAVAAFVVAALA